MLTAESYPWASVMPLMAHTEARLLPGRRRCHACQMGSCPEHLSPILNASPMHDITGEMRESGMHCRGYTPMSEETLDAPNQTEGDTKEGLYFGREVSADSEEAHMPLHGPNQWPTQARFLHL